MIPKEMRNYIAAQTALQDQSDAHIESQFSQMIMRGDALLISVMRKSMQCEPADLREAPDEVLHILQSLATSAWNRMAFAKCNELGEMIECTEEP